MFFIKINNQTWSKTEHCRCPCRQRLQMSEPIRNFRSFLPEMFGTKTFQTSRDRCRHGKLKVTTKAKQKKLQQTMKSRISFKSIGTIHSLIKNSVNTFLFDWKTKLNVSYEFTLSKDR